MTGPDARASCSGVMIIVGRGKAVWTLRYITPPYRGGNR